MRAHGVPLLEAEGAIVHAARQAEAVFGQGRLAPEVAAIHGAELADGDVAFVDEDEGIVGQIFEEGRGRLAGLAAGEVARIVLDAGAGAGGFHHLEVEERALFEALASRKRPAPLSSWRRAASSDLMSLMAWFIVVRGVTWWELA